jgi:branched-chain amino acid transport system ATP-binding protein
MTSNQLTVSGLRACYGHVESVSDVGFTIDAGEMVAFVGRNGAGKTTSLLNIGGLRFGSMSGTIRLGDVDLSRATPTQIVKAGVKVVPEGRRLFREMTVLENLRLGAFSRRRGLGKYLASDLADVLAIFPMLERDIDKPVASLSGGQQQMLAIGQALMTKPRFLLLDEPTAGLAPVIIDGMYDSFTAIAAAGVGILIVDQNIERVMESTSRYYVVEDGRVVASGACGDADALARVTAIVLGQTVFPGSLAAS